MSDYLYLIGGGGHHKIGISGDVARRAREIQRWVPFRVEIVHSISLQNPRIAERILHECFAIKRTYGEWFALDPIDVYLICSLRRHEDFIAIRDIGNSIPNVAQVIWDFQCQWGGARWILDWPS